MFHEFVTGNSNVVWVVCRWRLEIEEEELVMWGESADAGTAPLQLFPPPRRGIKSSLLVLEP